MASSLQRGERRRMGAEEEKRQVVNGAVKVKTPSLTRTSPYMKRSLIPPAALKMPPSRQSAPVSGARTAKIPSKSPATTCNSAPAAGIRSPAGGMPALNPPLKAKRGASSVSLGVVRERQSVPSMQKEPQMKCPTPYVLIPARLKRTRLKLLDPEKVKNLTSRPPVSGDIKQNLVPHQTAIIKQNLVPHQTAIIKQPLWRCKKNTLPRSSVKQTESSRKRTGITSRRENINQSRRPKILSEENVGDHKLSHQMNQLLLDDKGCDESRTGDNGQVDIGPPQTAQPGYSPHDARDSGQTVQDNAGSLEESNLQDNLKPPHLTDSPTTSALIEEMEGNDIKQDIGVTESSSEQPGDVQEPPPGDKESLSQPSCHGEENQATKQSHTKVAPTDNTQQPDPDIDAIDGLYKTCSETEPTTEAHGQGKSSRSHLKDTGTDDPTSQPASHVSKNSLLTESNSAEDDSMGEKGITVLGPDEHNATKILNQERLNQHVWSRTNEVIRQSQGVLVLTRSTDENAVFVPKLKFEFTPDNSIDWTAIGPPPLDSNKGGPTKKNDSRVLNACTPRGPTFSKSVLKKSFMLPGQNHLPGGFSESALKSFSAGDVTRNSSHPLDRIVDLSISFQGKFEEPEIPADIPKILLTEEDDDED